MDKADNDSLDYEIYRREYIPFQSNPEPDNASWVGKDCPACQGWAPIPTDKPKPYSDVNLTILPMSALLVFVIGMCINIVNWFHKDMKIRKHMDILMPPSTNIRLGRRRKSSVKRSSSILDFSKHALDIMLATIENSGGRKHSRQNSKKDPVCEDNLLLASSSSTSYASVFSADMQQPGINRISSVKTIADTPPRRPKERASRKGSEGHGVKRYHTPLMGSRKQSTKSPHHSDDPVPVVMYLDRAKLQRQMQRHLENQAPSALQMTGSYTDLTSRKQSMVSSGYASSASNSRTESQIDISQATSIAELCSDKVNSPIQVLSPAVCDHLVIGNLLSKSSFLLHIPGSNPMSPTPVRYSGSPNGFIEDCFIFPGSGSVSLDRSPGSTDVGDLDSQPSQDAASVSATSIPASSPNDSVISTSTDTIKLHADELPDAFTKPACNDTFHEENECHPTRKDAPPTIPKNKPTSAKIPQRDFYQLTHIHNPPDEFDETSPSTTSPSRPDSMDFPDIHKPPNILSRPITSPDILQLRSNRPRAASKSEPNGLPPRHPNRPTVKSSPTKSILKPTSPIKTIPAKVPQLEKVGNLPLSPQESNAPAEVHSPPRPTTLTPPSPNSSDSQTSPSRPTNFKRLTVRKPQLDLANKTPDDDESSTSECINSPVVVEADVHAPPLTPMLNKQLLNSKDNGHQKSVTPSPDSLVSQSPECEWMVGDDFYSIKESTV